jgi:hypothetical protein
MMPGAGADTFGWTAIMAFSDPEKPFPPTGSLEEVDDDR